MPDQNPDIQTMQAQAVALFNQLQLKLNATTSYDDAQNILREMQEVNHRITVAGTLLFKQQSAGLTAKVQAVTAASASAQAAIAAAASVKNIMDAVTGFLGLVDTALDFAKML